MTSLRSNPPDDPDYSAGPPTMALPPRDPGPQPSWGKPSANRSPLPIRPEPHITQVGHLSLGAEIVTVITRRWQADRPRRCLLCPAGMCSAYKGVCTVAVASYVPAEEAKWFDASGFTFAGPGLPLRVVGMEGGAS